VVRRVPRPAVASRSPSGAASASSSAVHPARASPPCCDASMAWPDTSGGASSSTAPRSATTRAPDRVRQRVGMVFQQWNLFPHLTILRTARWPRCA
jgi:hypothetical protein